MPVLPLATQKNVNWEDFERVDLDDLNALSTLKDAELKELMRVLMEPSAYGRVLFGLSGVAGAGLTFDFDGVDGYAMDAAGGVLETLAAAPLTATLNPTATNYVHGYLIETDSDSDARRFLNTIPSPPEEFSQSTPTRTSKIVGLYITSNADAVPLQSSFSTSAFLSGKTRQLVSLYAMKTNGAGVIGGSIVDFRQMWTINGNQIPAPNGGADELPATFSGSNGDRGIQGLRTMFKAIVSCIRSLTGNTATRNWWDTSVQDLENLVVSTTLQRRNQADKSIAVSVSPVSGVGDTQSISTGSTLVSGMGSGKGRLFLRAGTHNADAVVNIAHQGSVDAEDANAVTIACTTFNVQAPNLLLRNLHIRATGGAYVLGLTSGGTVHNVVFENCVFEAVTAGVPLFSSTSGTGTYDVRFVNCTFIGTGHLAPGGWSGHGGGEDHPYNASFEGCRFRLEGGTAYSLFGSQNTTRAKAVYFSDCHFGESTSAGWLLFGTACNLVDVVFRGCQFWSLEGLGRCATGDVWNAVRFHDCEMLNFIGVPAAAAFIRVTDGTATFVVEFWDTEIFCNNCFFLDDSVGNGSPQLLNMRGCKVNTGISTARPMFFLEGGSRLRVHLNDSQFFCGNNNPVTFGGLASGTQGDGGAKFLYLSHTLGLASPPPRTVTIDGCVSSATPETGTSLSNQSAFHVRVHSNTSLATDVPMLSCRITGCEFRGIVYTNGVAPWRPLRLSNNSGTNDGIVSVSATGCSVMGYGTTGSVYDREAVLYRSIKDNSTLAQQPTIAATDWAMWENTGFGAASLWRLLESSCFLQLSS